MKYVILSDTKSGPSFKVPRQLTEINGEPIIKRTIRLLKENGVKDILVTSHDERFDNLGVTRYESKYNDYDAINKTGYWLSAFPVELLKEPITFVWGDVYYSENAIKTIVETEAKDNLFFCTYQNKDKRYIKDHDEPFAYKVVDYKKFLKHIEIVKKLYDEGKTVRHPIVWELYRSLNDIDVNKHIMTKNYVAINDESCDIDSIQDIILLQKKIGGENMIKCETIKEFTLERFDELQNLVRYNPNKNEKGRVYVRDVFECSKELADYLAGNNADKQIVIKVIEIIPEEKVIKEKAESKPKTTKKKKTKKIVAK